jgi:hypothetical protein
MWDRTPLKNLIVPLLLKKLSSFYWTPELISVFRAAQPVTGYICLIVVVRFPAR